MDHTEVKDFLQELYTHAEGYAVDDDPVTTWNCAGAVLIASVLADSRDPNKLAAMTQLPCAFVDLVIYRAEIQYLMFEYNWSRLVDDLRSNPLNFELSENAICAVLEDLWRREPLPWYDWALWTSRDGRLIGGGTQWWSDVENPAPNSPQWVH